MNLFAFSSILVLISNLTLSLMMFVKYHKHKAAVTWGFMCLSCATWALGSLIFSTTSFFNTAYLGWQIANIGTIMGPATHHHFVCDFLNLENNKKFLFRFIYPFAGILLYINLFYSELFIPNLEFKFNQFYYINWFSNKPPLYFLTYIGLYWVLLTYSFYLIVQGYLKSSGKLKIQLFYILLSVGIGWTGAHGDFLPVFNINTNPFFFNSLMAIYPFIISYAIIRHKLMDIDIVIKKSLIYSISLALISIFYLLIVLTFETFLRKTFGYESVLVSIITAFILGVLFLPIRNAVQKLIDKNLYGRNLLEIEAENIKLREEVAQKERFKAAAALASGLAHEIKNPLTAILTFSEYLPKKMDDKEFLQSFSKIASKEVKRIDSLVDQLIDFSKPAPLKIVTVDLVELIKEILNFLSSEFLKRKVKAEITINEDIPTIEADPNQLRQALYNVILNSIQAMPGGGKIDITFKNPRPKVIEIVLEDTGKGMTKAEIKHIFEPFFSQKEAGTGLGLAITYGIIRQHKGKIYVASKIGAGTRFIIRLPTNLIAY